MSHPSSSLTREGESAVVRLLFGACFRRVTQYPLSSHLIWSLFGFCFIITNLVYFTCVFVFSFMRRLFSQEPVDVLMLSALRFPLLLGNLEHPVISFLSLPRGHLSFSALVITHMCI